MRSAIHQALTHLILVSKADKLEGDMWLQGANQLVLWVMKNNSTFYLTCDHC